MTGAPSNLPINVVLPNNCASDAVSDNVAMFPQLFVLDMIDDDDTTSNGSDDGETGSAVLVLDIIGHFTLFVDCNDRFDATWYAYAVCNAFDLVCKGDV